MGFLSYENHDVEIDDRTLAHLHVVIVNKLRHGQSFAMSWKDGQSSGGGRTSVWIHPASNVLFHFDGSRAPALNRTWLSELAASADSSRGLIVEPEERAAAPVRAAVRV
ncbi:ATP-dependent DNA ligase [Leifsonia virtsii]|uniref:ATP-dependent DNA ligase n=1 Tax=Leifsonia virtsii TaxID=3035915 RepID=A0ABT8J1W0_9MICO|nr:ATP-dependent DNA ligase [Leifsonia virtsii]MDN4599066.1 ATP-dependent DNA ligase [Leifsonia virtsii]